MKQESRLWELYSIWQKGCERGEDIPAEELCRDSPELLPELRKQLDACRKMNRLVDPAAAAQSVTMQRAAPDTGGTLDDSELRTQQHHAPTSIGPGAAVPGYEILGELGRGGMGVVYRARQKGLNRIVALKMILLGGHADVRERARFLAEAESIAHVRHPGIIQVYDFGTHDGLPYFSLELCERGSLADRLRDASLPPREAAQTVERITRAVQAAHEAGVVHRDLKPANVLIGNDGLPRITDFGLAKRDDGKAKTTTGAVMGTPSYMSPEQAQSSRDVGPATDVYALGAILYECLTGQPPFRAATAMDTLSRVVKEEPVPLRRLNARVPAELETIALKCLRKEPQKRYADAAALADDLSRWMEGRPILARPTGTVERAAKWVRRNPVVSALTAMTALLLVAGTTVAAILAAWALDEAERANDRELDARNALVQLQEETEKRHEADAKRHEADTAKLALEKKAREAIHEKLEQALIRDRTTRLSVYGRTMNDAHGLWKADRAGEALGLLATLDQDLRGWEWGHLQRLTRRTTLKLEGHTKPIGSLVWTDKGNRFLTCSEDVLKVWDARTLTALQSFEPRPGGRFCSVASGDAGTILLVEPAGDMRVLDPNKGYQERWSCTAQGNGARLLAWSANGNQLFASEDDTFFTASLKAGGARETSRTPFAALKAPYLCFGPNAKYVVGGSDDGTVRFWNSETRRETFARKGHSTHVNGLVCSLDGKRVVSSSRDKTLKIWDPETGQDLSSTKSPQMLNVLCISPDGKRVVWSNVDRDTATVWDVEKGQEKFVLKGHSNRVYCAAFTADGKRIVTAGDKSPRVWDAETGRQTLLYDGHKDSIPILCVSPVGNGIATGDSSGMVRVWNAETGRETFSRKAHVQPISALVFSSDGTRLASSSSDGTMKIWDVETGRQAMSFEGHLGGVKAAACSPDGTKFVSAAMHFEMRVWDMNTGQVLNTIVGNQRDLSAVALSPDGKRIVAGALDGSVKVWDVETKQEQFALQRHSSGVTSVAFSPDGKRIASGSWDNSARISDAKTGQELHHLKSHMRGVKSVAFSPDGNRLSTAGQDETLKVWDVESGRELFSLKTVSVSVSVVAYSPDGKRLLSGNNDGTLHVRDATSGTALVNEHAGSVFAVAASPDGKLFASGSADRTVRLGDPATGGHRLTLTGHADAVTCLAFSPDSAQLASGSADRTVRIWNCGDGKTVRTLGPFPGPVQCVAFHPGRKLLFVGCKDGTAVAHHLENGERAFDLRGHTGAVLSVACALDGSRIVTGSADGSARLWDASGTELHQLKGHAADVTTVGFLGGRVLSGSLDKTLKLWDVGTGREIMTLKGHTAGVAAATFSPDGQRIFSGGRDRTLRVWDAASGTVALVLPMSDSVHAIAVASDGRQVLCGTEGKAVQLLASEPWEAVPGK